MPVVAEQSALVNEASSVRLARYAQIIEYPECNFFGVNNPNISTGFQCREIWSKPQRDTILKYLAEGQYEIEKTTGYFLSPKYVGQGQSAEYQDWQPYRRRDIKTGNHTGGEELLDLPDLLREA
jgi:hypothetical protein